jgi:hypothetical protein
MCRNIRVLRDFQPPTTPDEIAAAALQYVRKVSGTVRPGAADREAFDAAVAEITASTQRLLAALPPGPRTRTREDERVKAKERWARREARMIAKA